MDFIKGSGGLYYLAALISLAVLIELFIPWRKGVKPDYARWLRNASMALYGTILLSLLPAIAAFAGAVSAQSNGIGLMNYFTMPLWAKLVISIFILDLMSYGQHRMLHKWYFFWRAHRTHHTDMHIDATTSLRFHPLESLFRAVIELGVVFTFGIPPEGILLSFLVHVFANTFSHTNISLPPAADRIVSRLITTPHIHRLHHSTKTEHQFSNFGTAFTIWDQMFGTYIGPEHLHENETFGVAGAENLEKETFGNLALDPFRTPHQPAIPKPAPAQSSAAAPGVNPETL
ncbi:sterol desaturase family protein [Hyphococcus sp.]|uniref:sterol desaturase family protein n=1 Tax=Hyphococcus sp. TaxID=2038636 RepID=UPI003CCBE2F5